MFITSKISPYEQGTIAAAAALQGLLDRLSTPYVDLLLIHWPGVAKKPLESPVHSKMRQETWAVLERALADGRARAIGVSNYCEHHLSELLETANVAPMVNQASGHVQNSRKHDVYCQPILYATDCACPSMPLLGTVQYTVSLTLQHSCARPPPSPLPPHCTTLSTD